MEIGSRDKIYSSRELAVIVDALRKEGIPEADALRNVQLSAKLLQRASTRVSLDQLIEVYRNAAALSRDPHFAFHTGMRFHVSSLGMYGFAILSSTNFRRTLDFAVKYHQLATAIVAVVCREEHHRVVWDLTPRADPRIDTKLCSFIIELHIAIIISLHREVVGQSFGPKEVHLRLSPPRDAHIYPRMLGCPVKFDQAENRVIFDSSWLDQVPQRGNAISYEEMVRLCDELLEQMQLRMGLAGKVREVLMMNRMMPMSCAEVADHLHVTERTLRRKLLEEGTAFREVVDQLRMRFASKYLRDTELSIEQIAQLLGFSEDASFRHAFRRWTKSAPTEYRQRLKSGTKI